MTKIAAAGDFHFGNPRINCSLLYNELRASFYPEVDTSDLVLLTGDLFDQLVTVNSDANCFISKFIRELFVFSAKSHVPIRILHGTYSHDRNQLNVLNELKLKDTDAKIVNEISCEDLVVKGKHFKVLYIPDNLSYKRSEEVMEHIDKVLTVMGWKTVDIVLGHGTFSHALPVSTNHLPPCTYTIEQFDKITTEDSLIIMGHIHISSHKKNVYYCGSFERMSHGEEQPKGFYAFDNSSGKWKATFVKNDQASLFVTIYPQGNTTAEIIADFNSQIANIFPNKTGNVRVAHNDPEIRLLLNKICLQEYPSLRYTSKPISDTEKTEIKLDNIELDTFDNIKPSRENLPNLICQFLLENNLGVFDKETINKYLTYIVEV